MTTNPTTTPAPMPGADGSGLCGICAAPSTHRVAAHPAWNPDQGGELCSDHAARADRVGARVARLVYR